MNQKGMILTILVVLVLLAAGGTAIYFTSQKKNASPQEPAGEIFDNENGNHAIENTNLNNEDTSSGQKSDSEITDYVAQKEAQVGIPYEIGDTFGSFTITEIGKVIESQPISSVWNLLVRTKGETTLSGTFYVEQISTSYPEGTPIFQVCFELDKLSTEEINLPGHDLGDSFCSSTDPSEDSRTRSLFDLKTGTAKVIVENYTYYICDCHGGGMLTEIQEVLAITTPDWKIYRNEQYGFEFEYPGYYDDIAVVEPGSTRFGTTLYFTENGEKQRIFPDLMLEISEKYYIAPVLVVGVFPMESYPFQGAQEVPYGDAEKAINKNNWTGYQSYQADAGVGVYTVRIPNDDKSIIVHFKLTSGIPTQLSPEESIVDTFRFTASAP